MSDLSRRAFLQAGATAATASTLLGASPGRQVSVDSGVAGGGLMAGVAKRDVSPPKGVPMWGYGDRADTAQGVLDPLYAKAVVLSVGDTRIAIVVTDMGRMPLLASCMAIREAVAKSGITDVVFSGTHTHGGPILEDPSLAYPGELEAAIIETILEAANGAEPATIAVGSATVDISHNRRVIKDGQCYMRWRNAERLPTSPIDHSAGIIRINRADGSPLANLIHYACHPVILGPDNLTYSADWCGEMCKVLEDETGAVSLFLQGGAGDINPYLDKTPLAEGGEAAMRGEGRLAAASILAAYGDCAAAGKGAPRIAYREQPVTVGTRWDMTDEGQVAILREAYGGRIYDIYLSKLTNDLALPLGVLVLNDAISLACTPGELFIQHQIDFRHQSPLPHSFLCGYVNDFHIYFPTVRDAALGGYGGITTTYVGVGAGEKMVTEAAIMTGEITGQLGPLTSAADFRLLELS